MNDWLARNFPLFPPDRATILAATRHLSGPQRKIGTPQEKHFVAEVVKAAGLISSKLGYAEAKEQDR